MNHFTPFRHLQENDIKRNTKTLPTGMKENVERNLLYTEQRVVKPHTSIIDKQLADAAAILEEEKDALP